MTTQVIEREKAAIGALITLREPTKPMLTEAASAGFYEPTDSGEKHIKVRRAASITKYPVNGWWFWKYERAPGDWVRLLELRK